MRRYYLMQRVREAPFKSVVRFHSVFEGDVILNWDLLKRLKEIYMLDSSAKHLLPYALTTSGNPEYCRYEPTGNDFAGVCIAKATEEDLLTLIMLENGTCI